MGRRKWLRIMKAIPFLDMSFRLATLLLLVLMMLATWHICCHHPLVVVASIPSTTPAERASVSSPPSHAPSPISIQTIGEPIPVWNSVDTWNKCHLIDVPDIPARAFVANTTIQMICGAVGYHEMHGPSLLNQTRSCDIAWNATKDADPSQFAANEFLDATVRFDNGTVIALIHTEYPGNRYNACDMGGVLKNEFWHGNNPQSRTWTPRQQRRRRHLAAFPGQRPLTYPSCWTVTIGLGISYDWGHTWQHISKPPHHLVAAVPYTYHQEYLAYGWGDPSNIVKHPNDDYYYATVWNRNQVGLQSPGICVMRTNDLMNPKSWRAWNGSDFAVSFVDPYRVADGEFDPQDHVCETLDIEGTTREDCNIFGLLWSHDLQLFIGTVGCDTDVSKSNAFYFSTSKDLIHWTSIREMFNRTRDLPPKVAAMTTSIHYPTLLDPVAFERFGDANFCSVGAQPFLFWTGTGHSPYKDGRHLWATPMHIQKYARL
jgi:hypothetical protein